MSTPPVNSTNDPTAAGEAPRGRRAFLERHRWAPFVLPFAVFLLVGSLEPKPEAGVDQADPGWIESVLPAIPYEYYPAVYTLKIALTIVAIVVVWPGYGVFPFRVSRWSVVVGVLGVVVWIGLCNLRLERALAGALGLDGFLGAFMDAGLRSAYNPLEQLAENAAIAWAFLIVRFLGLVVVVALIEEMFLRGFAMRFADDASWWTRPMGRIGAAGFAVSVLLPVLSHPGEPLAAAVWFSMVTLLSMKTRNIWDCVAAHAITNLLLGIYVVMFGQWSLM